MEPIVDQILDMEWEMFGAVQNIGGRAACQDDPATFRLQRGSQLCAWTPDMQKSYLDDLIAAHGEGRNPLAEKYGYMMEHTSPAEYEKICAALPPVSAAKKALIAEIAEVQVRWLKELSKQYPYVTGNGRPITEGEDSMFDTSFETYLKGELATYSQKTLEYYAQYVRELLQQGRNLNEIILKNTCLSYGYSSIEDVEKCMTR